MTTKQWLMRARNIDREIDSLVKARGELYDRVTKITQSYTGDVVQSTKDPHRFEALTEYEMEIDRQIDKLIDVKREINAAINELHDWRLRSVCLLYTSDSLWGIAEKVYGDGTKYALIMSANNLADSFIYPGQELIIPAGSPQFRTISITITNDTYELLKIMADGWNKTIGQCIDKLMEDAL